MTAKTIQIDKELAEVLKQTYSINKNITQALTKNQKEELINILEVNETVLALVNSFIAKNNELGNRNRRFGRQREDAKRNLLTSEERNEELATEVSQLRYQLIELKRMIRETFDNFHDQLLRNMLDRSEIIRFSKDISTAFKR